MGFLSVIKHAPKAAVRLVGKAGFALKKASPQLLVGGGLVVMTGAFVLAIVNARKIDSAIAINEAKMDELEQKRKDIEAAANITDDLKKQQLKEVEKELNRAKTDGILKMFWLIAVPSLAFLGGMSMSVGGYVIVVKRFGQLSTFCAGLMESFNRYRQHNIAEHGEECDRRYMYGIVDKVPGTEKVIGENGKEKTVKTLTPVVDPREGASLYSFVFSEEFSRKCPKDPVNTISFLRSQEKYWNVWMRATGKPVTLSMVLDDLGIELDPDDPMNDYILISGWRPNGDGDNQIDFGIMRAINKRTLDMQENVVMLNFNCDGNLYHSSRYDKNGRKVC